jgi:hypothetical protein
VTSDPATQGSYEKIPNWSISPSNNAIVLTDGVAGGEYAVIISVRG